MGVMGSLSIKDGASTPVERQLRYIDESGTGVGPWRAVAMLSKGDLEATDWNYAAPGSGILNTVNPELIRPAPGSGSSIYVTAIQLFAEAGGETEFAIRSNSREGPIILWLTKIGAGGLPDGRSIVFRSPLRAAGNAALEALTLSARAGAVYFNLEGFVAAGDALGSSGRGTAASTPAPGTSTGSGGGR